MNRKEIMSNLNKLAKYQGYYDRIVDMFNNMNKDDYNTCMEELEEKNFDSVVDLILYFEDGAHYERTNRYE